MMRALVVFESMFGDTKAVADAVACGLAGEMRVRILEVGEAPVMVDETVDVLVVGGPTHAFGLSRPATRDYVTRQAAAAGVLSDQFGLREWLTALAIHPNLQVAASTPASTSRGCPARPPTPRNAGCAGRLTVFAGGKLLRRRHPGPLIDGELDRAMRWGRDLSVRVPHPGVAW